MTVRHRGPGLLATVAAVAIGGYAAWAATAWSRYGRLHSRETNGSDELLDRFMPAFEIVERHQLRVAAPAAVTFGAAAEQDIFGIPLVRAIFRMREIVLRAASEANRESRGLLDTMQSLGWGVLAHVPDREIVMGAVTRPWEADVKFQALPPEGFASFSEPGFVKIAWTLRADPMDDGTSLFRTETRAVATDAAARARFRRYWAFASPGIVLIRRLLLRPLKREAERRYRSSARP